MNNKRISLGISGSDGFVAQEYQTILNRATSLGYALPDINTQYAGTQLIADLKNAGIWDKLDAFWVFATTGDQNFSLLNWKNPTTFQASIVGTLQFRAKGGFTFSSPNYINTNFNPATNGSQYTQDNASRAIYVTSPCLPAVSPLVVLDGNLTASVNSARNCSQVTNRINSAASLTTAIDWQGGGLKVINRPDNNTVIMTSGLTSSTSTPNTSTTILNASQFIGRSGGGYYNGEIGFYALGSDMSGLTSRFVSALQTYFRRINSSFDPSYQAIINRATVLGYNLPSAYCQAVQNDIVVKLKAAGLWSKLDVLYVMDNDASTVDFATLNWVNPLSFQLTLYNSPTWTPKQGITTNSTQYFDTGWIPSSNAVKYKQDNATVYTRIENFSSGSYLGTTSGTAGLLHLNTANTVTFYLNSTNPLASTPSTAPTHLGRSFSRTTSTDVNYNGITVSPTVVASTRGQVTTGLPTLPILIGRSAGTYCPALYKTVFFGEGMTDNEIYVSTSILMNAYGAF